MAPAFRLASVLFVTSLVCGCASTQITWSRADGKPIDPGQLAVDQTACGGEVQMTDLTGDNDEIELLLTGRGKSLRLVVWKSAATWRLDNSACNRPIIARCRGFKWGFAVTPPYKSLRGPIWNLVTRVTFRLREK